MDEYLAREKARGLGNFAKIYQPRGCREGTWIMANPDRRSDVDVCSVLVLDGKSKRGGQVLDPGDPDQYEYSYTMEIDLLHRMYEEVPQHEFQ